MNPLGFILKLLTGGGVGGLAAEIRGARADQLAANNDSERLAANERMYSVAARVEAQTQGSGSWIPKTMRALFGLVVLVYFAKLLIWDKVVGWGATDPLTGFADWTARAVVLFYFLDSSIRQLRG